MNPAAERCLNAEAFTAHWNGASIQQARRDAEGLLVSLIGVRCDIAE
jgi:hypothetical protein